MIAGMLTIIVASVASLVTGIQFRWVGLLLIGVTLVYTFGLCQFRRNRVSTAKWRPLFLAMGITGWPLLIFAVVQILIFSAGRLPLSEEYAYIMVPGAGIVRTEPSVTLARRLDVAVEYMHLHPESRVIVSGGHSEGQLASEAQVMAWYLERMGIVPERIMKEENSSNTMENVAFTLDLLEEKKGMPVDQLLIVTSDYHLLRTQLLARRMNCQTRGIRAPSPSGLYRHYAFREFFAVFKSMIVDR